MPKRLMGVTAAALAVMLFAGAAGAESLRKTVTASRVVDLTHPMHDAMAYWPGGVPFKLTRLVDYDKGYRLHKGHRQHYTRLRIETIERPDRENDVGTSETEH